MPLSVNRSNLQSIRPIAPKAIGLLPSASSPRFGSDRVSFTGKPQPADKPPHIFKRFWRWLKGLPKRIQLGFKRLWLRTPAPSSKPEPVKPVPYSKVDPKLINDPYERRRISMQLADETFDEAVRLHQKLYVEDIYKAWTHDEEGGGTFTWNLPIGKLLTEKAQKLLNTNTKLAVQFFDNEGGGALGCYSPPHTHINGPNSSRDSLGMVSVYHPDGLRYDFNKPTHRQAAYSVYLHELAHMVRAYAHNKTVDTPRPPDDPNWTPESKDLFTDFTIGAVANGAAQGVVARELRERNPGLPPLPEAYEDRFNTNVDAYWEPFKALWERTDFPLINRVNPDHRFLKQKLDKFLNEADPTLVKQWMERYTVNEFESYLTAIKRAPGLPKDKLQPSDLAELSVAMFLRDLLRYYYQHPRHKVPPEEQHPMTQVKPLELIL